jgi:hypothetical protein
LGFILSLDKKCLATINRSPELKSPRYNRIASDNPSLEIPILKAVSYYPIARSTFTNTIQTRNPPFRLNEHHQVTVVEECLLLSTIRSIAGCAIILISFSLLSHPIHKIWITQETLAPGWHSLTLAVPSAWEPSADHCGTASKASGIHLTVNDG